MHPFRLAPLLLALALALPLAAAENAAPVAASAQPPASVRRAAAALKAMKLTDAAREAKVRALLEAHFAAMEQWHAMHDATLTPLWAEWTAQRALPNRGDAAQVGEKIDAVYASFRPQHDAFLAALAAAAGPAEVEVFKNQLTRSPGMDRTANAYIEMIPAFTDADRAFVRARFRLAREQAIDTTAGREVDAFFKRQKDIVEAYIDEHGYDYRKSREAWIQKTNAAGAAAKAAKAAGSEAKKE